MIEEFDTIGVKFFLANFKKINYDQVLNKMTDHKIDSVLALPSAYRITVEGIDGNKKSIRSMLRKNQERFSPKTGVELTEYDVDLMFATMDEKEILLIQYFVFDPVLKSLNYFLANNALVEQRG